MSLEPKSFRYAFDPDTGVATVTLDRPKRLNALTFEVYRELRDAFQTLDTAPGVRSILLTGSGRAFCSGGDVEDIIGPLFERDYRGLLEFTRNTGDLILAMLRCRRPIVGALNGTVAGAGAVIAAAWCLAIALLLPHATLLLISFVPPATWTVETLPPVLAWSNYQALFDSPARLEPILNSVWMAAAATAGAASGTRRS